MTVTKFALIISVIELLMVIISTFIGQLDDISPRKKKIFSSVIIVVSIVITIGIVFFVNNYDFKSEYAEMTEEELLSDAQRNYDLENYLEVLYIYRLEKMNANAIALSNLGYMYENALGVAQDYNLARQYYKKAARLQDYNCLDNWVAFSINNPDSYKNLIECLDTGFRAGNDNVIMFIINCIKGKNYGENFREQYGLAKGFFDLSYEEQEGILSKVTYEIDKDKRYYKINYEGDFVKNYTVDVEIRKLDTVTVKRDKGKVTECIPNWIKENEPRDMETVTAFYFIQGIDTYFIRVN